MSLRILHTADWHLGCPFGAIPGDAGARLREERFEAVRRIAKLARERQVAAVLVAGDVFDRHHIDDRVLRRTLQAMADYRGLWVLMPGNHDHWREGCLWSRMRRLGLPTTVTIAERNEPIRLADGIAEVLPAPLTARRSPDDPTGWMDDHATPTGIIRIGLAHGAVNGLVYDAPGSDNPIARDRTERARLDYLALGDRHGTLEAAAKAWYAGTPEPDHHRYQDAGNILLVEIIEPGLPPRVEKIPVACHIWLSHELVLRPITPDEIGSQIEGELRGIPDPSRTVLHLKLSGSVDLVGRLAVDAALEPWQGLLRHLDIDDEELVVVPGDDDLARLDDGGIVGVAARALRALALSGNPDERATAELALRLLWQERQST